EILAEWHARGWATLMGRTAEAGDLIVPSRAKDHRSANHMLKRFHEDCTRVEVPNRRQHDARRTFISLARAGGANADTLKAVTHGRSQEILDLHDDAVADALRCCPLPQGRISSRSEASVTA